MMTDRIVEAVLTALAFMRALMDAALASLSGLVQAHPVVTEVLVVVVIVGLIAMGYISLTKRRLRNFNIFRGRHMTKEERERAVGAIIADHVSEVLDRLLYEGKINALEAHRYYNRLGHTSGLSLLDLRKSKLRLTDEERQQLRIRQATAASRVVAEEKPNIPGPKPGEEVPVKETSIKKAGGWADRFRGRLKTA